MSTRTWLKRKSVVGIVVLVFAGLACLRWSGRMPMGSDTDEHLLVARTMLETGHFTVGQMHGTKYPPVISSLAIAATALGVDPARFVLAANALYILTAGLLLANYADKKGGVGWAGLAAAVYLMSNPVLWNSAQLVIADTLFVLLTTGVLLMAIHVERWTWLRVGQAVALVVLATLSRSVGVVLAVPLVVALWRRRGWAIETKTVVGGALVLGLPVVLLGLYMLYQGQFGFHPTGYAETVFLRDPYDASRGVVTVSGLVGRAAGNTVGTAWDTVKALAAGVPSVGGAIVAVACAGVVGLLVTAACLGNRHRAWVVLGFAAPYVAVLCLWPYGGARFALPLLPVGAIGLARVVGWTTHKGRRWGVVLVMVMVTGYVVFNARIVYRARLYEADQRSEIRVALEDVASWCRSTIPAQDAIASFDYRELALQMDRSVVYLGYTSDMDDLARRLQQQDVHWLVVSEAFFARRGRYGRALVEHLGPGATRVYGNRLFEVYRIGPLTGREGDPADGTSVTGAPPGEDMPDRSEP